MRHNRVHHLEAAHWLCPDEPSLFRRNFAERLRQLRKGSGLSQLAFSDMIGLERAYYARIEVCKVCPSIDILPKLAAGHGLSVSQLLEGVAYDHCHPVSDQPLR